MPAARAWLPTQSLGESPEIAHFFTIKLETLETPRHFGVIKMLLAKSNVIGISAVRHGGLTKRAELNPIKSAFPPTKRAASEILTYAHSVLRDKLCA